MLAVDVDEQGDTTLLVLRGDLDLAAAPRFRSAVQALPRRARSVTVELAGVHHVDSVGLGLLIGLVRRVRAAGQALSVVHPPALLRQMVALCGLETALPFVEPPASPANPNADAQPNADGAFDAEVGRALRSAP